MGILSYGSNGEEVKKLQERLNVHGASLTADGDFGKLTEAAVKDFQLKSGLAETGIVNDPEWVILLSAPERLRHNCELKHVGLTSTSKSMGTTSQEKAAAQVWRSYGGLLRELGEKLAIEPAAAVAVLCVESSGSGFAPDGKMIIRFENHIFYDKWGKTNPVVFNRHFSYNTSQRWLDHKYRVKETDPWITLHTGLSDQYKEWDVLNFASTLNEEAACLSASYGIAQIMGFNFKQAGFIAAKEMLAEYKLGIREQLISFFEFIRGDKIMHRALKAQDWVKFAERYNGSGQAAVYGEKIKTYYLAAKKVI